MSMNTHDNLNRRILLGAPAGGTLPACGTTPPVADGASPPPRPGVPQRAPNVSMPRIEFPGRGVSMGRARYNDFARWASLTVLSAAISGGCARPSDMQPTSGANGTPAPAATADQTKGVVAASAKKKMKVVFVASNQVKSVTTGYPIGFWLSELAQPFAVFTDAGYEITIASPDGGKIAFDGWSDPEGPNAREIDVVSTGFKHHPKTAALMEATAPLKEIKESEFDAIFVVGGLGPMQTFYNNEVLHKLFAQFYEAGKASATICHGSAILLKAKLSNGILISEGKTWTGFSNAEEDIVDKGAGKKMQPFRIQDEATNLHAKFVTGPAPYKSFAVADGNLISGQQGSSGTETAKLVVQFASRAR